MKAGVLKEIVKFLTPVEIKSDFGSTSIEYKEEFTTRASVKYSTGDREVINNEILNTYNYIFTIRKYHKVNEKMLIQWKDKNYRIRSIDDTDESKITITTELVND